MSASRYYVEIREKSQREFREIRKRRWCTSSREQVASGVAVEYPQQQGVRSTAKRSSVHESRECNAEEKKLGEKYIRTCWMAQGTLLRVMGQPGWEGSLRENGCTHTRGQVPLLSAWNYHNTVRQLYPITKWKVLKRRAHTVWGFLHHV